MTRAGGNGSKDERHRPEDRSLAGPGAEPLGEPAAAEADAAPAADPAPADPAPAGAGVPGSAEVIAEALPAGLSGQDWLSGGPGEPGDSAGLAPRVLGRGHVAGFAAALVIAGAIFTGVFAVGATEVAPPSNAVSNSAPFEASGADVTGASGLSAVPGLDVVTAARLVSEAMSAVRPGSTPATRAKVKARTAPSSQRLSAVAVSTAIPARMILAYRTGERIIAARYPRCNLRWWLLAGIGRVESGHAAGGAVDAKGVTLTRILGPRLDGTTPGTAVITDSDAGRYDGDPLYDRAVGPMQFLPGTWAGAGLDGNGDRIANPNQVDDAAASAGGYLCAAGGDLSDPDDLARAILRYNNSRAYVQDVLAGAVAYRNGVKPVSSPHRVGGTASRTATAPAPVATPATPRSTSGRVPPGRVSTPAGTSARTSVPAGTTATTAPTATTVTTPVTPGPSGGTSSPSGLPTCRPARPGEVSATTPATPGRATAASPPATASPSGSQDWEPGDPRIAHLPVCPTPAAAVPTGTGTLTPGVSLRTVLGPSSTRSRN